MRGDVALVCLEVVQADLLFGVKDRSCLFYLAED